MSLKFFKGNDLLLSQEYCAIVLVGWLVIVKEAAYIALSCSPKSILILAVDVPILKLSILTIFTVCLPLYGYHGDFTHTHTHTNTHTHTHTHTRTHARTHTHTHSDYFFSEMYFLKVLQIQNVLHSPCPSPFTEHVSPQTPLIPPHKQGSTTFIFESIFQASHFNFTVQAILKAFLVQVLLYTPSFLILSLKKTLRNIRSILSGI